MMNGSNGQVVVITLMNCWLAFVIFVLPNRVFWRKVLDIYATSIDYEPKNETSMLFFKTIQNKLHWAAHGQTAAEVIHRRVDATKPNLGLTSWEGAKPRKTDVSIGKNYLAEDEMEALNRIVTGLFGNSRNCRQ